MKSYYKETKEAVGGDSVPAEHGFHRSRRALRFKVCASERTNNSATRQQNRRCGKALGEFFVVGALYVSRAHTRRELLALVLAKVVTLAPERCE